MVVDTCFMQPTTVIPTTVNTTLSQVSKLVLSYTRYTSSYLSHAFFHTHATKVHTFLTLSFIHTLHKFISFSRFLSYTRYTSSYLSHAFFHTHATKVHIFLTLSFIHTLHKFISFSRFLSYTRYTSLYLSHAFFNLIPILPNVLTN